MRIVYMGTPDFAVAPLQALLEGGFNVVGIVTMPDKAMGRHQTTPQYSPIKKYALEHGLPILQPEKLKDASFLEALRSWGADLQVVVAFRMLPQEVWDMPSKGTINLHASLLPQYRGAAPINWAIINGEKETGVSTFFLTHQIDTGKLILQDKMPIDATDDAGSVHDKLMVLGAELLVQTLAKIQEGNVVAMQQSQFYTKEEDLRSAPKIFKPTCQINWNKTGKEVYDFVRGLSPYPAAWSELTTLAGDLFQLKVFETEFIATNHEHDCGAIVSDGKHYLHVAVLDGFIALKSIQATGKKRMSVSDFLRGNGRFFM
ncbi:L-methionyl-tRNA(fMet) N-formyltransferase [Bacteroidales bacterium]|nr:L-methionyl-tRNA(fMet) N-formyltransferase [Bacteroidales bacterium]